MNKLTQSVLDTLYKNNVNKDKVLETLSLIYRELEISLWEVIKVSPTMLYALKDVIWYNLEHLPNGGEIKGISDLRYLGTKYPNLIYCFNESLVVKSENVPPLLIELDNIVNQWNKDWMFVSLFTKTQEGWNGGENPSSVIIYDSKTESPSHYGYNSNYGSILGVDGKAIKKFDISTVLCAIDIPIGEYVNGQILYNLLFQLREVCKKAIKNQRDVKIQFE